ncbi:unnamed protein product [marine sediment metagenome]|uniref:Uncharacterized protein n=1 Tax=marine sediment metagenome TaxID=412755 RepID=X1VW40_9ZZZZ
MEWVNIIFFVVFLACSVGFVLWYDSRKYKKNIPYIQIKKKRKNANKFFVGLLAGLHYLFFIGTYNHKKYNTQVEHPETLECHVAVYASEAS